MEELRAGGVVFLADSFCCEDEEFLYEDVLHLERYAKRTSVNLIPVGDRLEIAVYVRGRRSPIELQNFFGLVGTAGTLKKIYALLAAKTFRARAVPYLQQWSEHDYFDYNCLRFYRSEEVEYKGGRIDLNACKFSREPFDICFKEKGRFFGKKATASTLRDQDVLFFLLEKLFGIKFG